DALADVDLDDAVVVFGDGRGRADRQAGRIAAVVAGGRDRIREDIRYPGIADTGPFAAAVIDDAAPLDANFIVCAVFAGDLARFAAYTGAQVYINGSLCVRGVLSLLILYHNRVLRVAEAIRCVSLGREVLGAATAINPARIR